MKFFLVLILIISFAFEISSESTGNISSSTSESCRSESEGGCHSKSESLKWKLVAIVSILVASMIGVTLPLLTRSIPALSPEKDIFVWVKAFSSGVILATGYMHVLPDSFDDLTSPCLPEYPWRMFPWTTFVAMLAAILTLMIDSFTLSYYKKPRCGRGSINATSTTGRSDDVETANKGYDVGDEEAKGLLQEILLKKRVVAQVLEMGIVVHSVVIGLSMGASENPCTIRPLIAALCFHQLFEGMGLGGCILQAEYGTKVKSLMVFFFSVTTPLGIVLGITLTNVYSEDSPAALIVVGLLNAASAGLLNYMALVELLAADFLGHRLQGNMKLQGFCYVGVLLGAAGMSVMALWA